MATLVTGGTGFVGSNIVRTLADRGHQVVCFDLNAPDDLVTKYMAPSGDQVTFVQGDILSKADLERAVDGRDVSRIVHAAVFTGTRADIEKDRSRAIVDINVAGTANLLDLACGLPLQRFLYVSSRSVYGDERAPNEVLREDVILHPRTLYASTKYVSELLTRRYSDLHGFDAVSVRLSSPYGPMERVSGHRAMMSAMYELTGAVVRSEPLRMGDMSAGRDYSYVRDTASAICTVLDAPSLSYDVYNISPGGWISLNDVVSALQELRPSVRVEHESGKKFSNLDPDASPVSLDVSRLREDVGFTPSFDLMAGLRDYLDWRESFQFRD